MRYLLDADVFLQAKNNHYGLDFCPAFWEWMAVEHAAGQVFSIAKVQGELIDADIKAWADAQPSTFFLTVDADATVAMPRVSEWATRHPTYTENARSEFFSKADYYLVSQSLAHGDTVVTHETAHPNSTKRVMIPDACAGVGVPCTTIFKLLRTLGAHFVLDK